MHFNCKLRFILFSIISLMGVIVFGQEDPTLIVKPTKIIFDENGGNKDITIDSDAAFWTMTMVGGDNSDSDASWIVLKVGETAISSGFEGTGKNTISLSVGSYNGAGKIRTATIYFFDGTNNKSISLSQYGPEEATISLDADKLTFGQPGGDLTFKVTSNVAWEVTSDKDWLTVKLNGSGAGNEGGAVTVTMKATLNDSLTPRTATITVSGGDTQQTIAVTQLGKVPFIEVSPTNISINKYGGNREIEVSSNDPNGWKASSNVDWLKIDGAAECLGNDYKKMTLTVKENTTGYNRTGNITVSCHDSTKVITVTQFKTFRDLIVSTDSLFFANKGSNKEITITSNVDWRAEVNFIGGSDWLTIEPDYYNGNNDVFDSTKVFLKVEDNIEKSEREAKILIKWNDGERDTITTIIVTQIARQSYLSLSTDSISYRKEGGSETFAVNSNADWKVKCSETWLRVTDPVDAKGSDKAYVTISVDETDVPYQRTAVVSIELMDGSYKEEVIVRQSGNAKLKTVSDINYTVKDSTYVFDITDCNVKWRAFVEEDKSWLRIKAPYNSKGEGNGKISLHADFNDDTSSGREAIVYIKYLGPDADSITQKIYVHQDRCPVVPNSIELKGIDVTNGVESTIGENVILNIDNSAYDNIDKWKYLWNVNGKNESSSSILIYNKDKFAEKKPYRVEIEIYYEDDPFNEKLKKRRSFTLYPSPKAPAELVRKGNGNYGIMIAIMDDVDDHELDSLGYIFVFGYGEDNIEGETVNRYYQYRDPSIVVDDAVKKWAYTKWKINGRTITSKDTIWYDSNKTTRSTNDVNIVDQNEIIINEGVLIANLSTPAPAYITIVSMSGKIVRETILAPSGSFYEVLDLDGLPEGIYMVECTVGNQRVKQKVVIK